MNRLKLFAFCCFILSATLSWSNIIEVTSQLDNGPGTLREGINTANPGDTVLVNISDNIILNDPIIISNTSSIWIIGPYAAHISIGADAGFTGNALIELNTAGDIHFEKLGFLSAGTPGVRAIDIVNSTANNYIDETMFENFQGMPGGAIFMDNGFLTVTRSGFVDNVSDNGGAIYTNNGDLKAINCTFSGNQASNEGGAIFFNGVISGQVLHCTFKNNSATVNGSQIAIPVPTGGSAGVIFQNNAAESLTSTLQFFDPSNVFDSQGGNKVRLSGFPDNDVPWSIEGEPQDVQSVGLPLNLGLLKTDGFGLKYHPIIDSTGALVDQGINSGNALTSDCRRAPRYLTGMVGCCTPSPNPAPICDAGAVEFSKLQVMTTSGNPNVPYSLGWTLSMNYDFSNYVEFNLGGTNIVVDGPFIEGNQPTYIDGYSQIGSLIPGPPPGGGGNIADAQNLVELSNGSGLPIGITLDGLVGGSVVSGLRIVDFDNFGITVNAVNSKIWGCEIGIYSNDNVAPNAIAGIELRSQDCYVGGKQHYKRNVISGNGGSGENCEILCGPGSIANQIFGNIIGLGGNGMNGVSPAPIGGSNGIWDYGNGNIIGHGSRLGWNVISGHFGAGIVLSGSADNQILHNKIGVGWDGSTVFSNGNGIQIETGASGFFIGGFQLDKTRNIITGNNTSNILIFDGNTGKIVGNYIGVDITGNTAPFVSLNGIHTLGFNVYDVWIGDQTANAGNVISNNVEGVYLEQSGGDVRLFMNKIGTNWDGSAPLGNQSNGVRIGPSAAPAFVGAAFWGNQISGQSNNGAKGILVEGGFNHSIQANIIGLNAAGSAALANDTGIDLNGTSSTLVGGDQSINLGNTISGNTKNGILVHNGCNSVNIQGNYIGTNALGTSGGVGNLINGIKVENSDATLIGGPGTFRNVIGGQDNAGACGIFLDAGGNTVVEGNYIGLNYLGTGAVPNETGVRVVGTHDATIGGGVNSENYICSSTQFGIHVFSPNTLIDGNFVGLGVGGITASTGNNVGIEVVAPNVQIGGNATYKNYISNNTSHGIHLNGNNADFISVDNCYIGFTEAGGVAGNGEAGLFIDQGDQNDIGTNTANYIGGNAWQGIRLENGADSNHVENNYIGEVAGVSGSDNTLSAIGLFTNCNYNVIGSNGLATGNTIATGLYGISLSFSDSNIVSGNLIGIDGASNPIPLNAGINLSGSEGNVIGKDWTGIGTENVIANATYQSILMSNSPGNVIAGNKIGTDITGTTLIQSTAGIYITGSSEYNQIGGEWSLGMANVISGAIESGIHIEFCDSISIFGNYIGMNASNTSGFNNQDYGVRIDGGSTGNVVGGPRHSHANIIAGNQNAGVWIDDAPGNLVTGNIIGAASNSVQNYGVQITGAASITNQIGDHPYYSLGNFIYENITAGILLDNGANDNDIRNNIIGLDSTNFPSGTITQNAGIYASSTSGLNNIGVDVQYGGNVISGNNNGVYLDGTTGQDVVNNFIGTDTSGNVAKGNVFAGVLITNSATNNVIGGNGPYLANYISGNPNNGIEIEGVGTNTNTVIGNYIGTSFDGLSEVPNLVGIEVTTGPSNNFIGLAGAGNENYINGNDLVGIDIYAANSNHVRNNRIGTAFPNTHGVIVANGSWGNVIGGSEPEGNVISGNDSVGLAFISAPSNNVSANIIGLTENGQLPQGNLIGVYLGQSSTNTIGGTAVGEENTISANTLVGIAIEDMSDDNDIINNFIGTDTTGNAVFGGSGNGVGIYISNSTLNTIGGDWNANEGNVICYNNLYGINLENAANNAITGNNIGLSHDNDTYLGNIIDGIRIAAGSIMNSVGASGNGLENVIVDNFRGIHITSADNNTVENNFIGNDELGGVGSVNNGVNDQVIGVMIDSTAKNNAIEGLNVISGNLFSGIGIDGVGTSGNSIQGNYIGVDINGNLSYENDSINIYITNGASSNLIGGSNPADKNIIGGDSPVHILISQTGTDSNQVAGNNVGLGLDNSTTYPSTFGIGVADGAMYNVVGGGMPNEGNNISSADSVAVYIYGSNQNRIFGNRIGVLPNDSPANVAGAGIFLQGADNTQIGGLLVGTDSANVIANCGKAGVDVGTQPLFNSSYGNAIIGNSIYNNGELGIDIDADDLIEPIDTNQTLGNNGDIDMPVIVDAWTCGDGNTHIGFKFFSNNALGTYRVEFYENSTPDGSGYGEGEVFLGDFPFMPGTNHDTIYIDLGQALTVGTNVTATVTGTLWNTSEFSLNYAITAPPTFNAPTVVDESCLGANDGEIQIDASGANYFSLDGGTTTTYGIGGDTLLVSPGTYTVSAQYMNGCWLDQSVTVLAGPPLPININVVDDTCGLAFGSVQIDTSITNANGGSGNYIYSFDGGTTTTGVNGLFSLNASTFDIMLIDTVTGCVSDTFPTTVASITDVVDESFAFPDLCPGEVGLPTNVITNGGTWAFAPNPSDGAMINTTTGEVSNTTVGSTYNIEYTVGICNEKDTVTITINPADDDGFTYPNFCLGSSPSIVTNTPGGTWSLASGPGSIDPGTGVITGTPGVYDVTYTTTGNCPNDSTQSVVMFGKPNGPEILMTDSLYCPGDALQALNTITSAGLTYEWYDDGTLTNLLSTTVPYTPGTINTGDNWFYLVSINTDGCVSFADSVNYQLTDLSGMYASPDQDVCIGSVIQLEAFGGVTYLWNASNQLLDPLDSQDPTARILAEEDFVVTITHLDGCVVSDTVSITLLPQDQCTVDVYNAFSPNDDGKNDVWVIDGIEGFPENTVTIFNRWGDVIIEITNYNNIDAVWDGTNKNGRKVATGTYFYIVDVNGSQTQSNWVQVVR